MNGFSGNTRVTLTVTGWLFMAQKAMARIERASDAARAAQLRRKALHSLRMALAAIDEERSSGGLRDLPRVSQRSPE